jgi:hypothetical protein
MDKICDLHCWLCTNFGNKNGWKTCWTAAWFTGLRKRAAMAARPTGLWSGPWALGEMSCAGLLLKFAHLASG